MRIKSSSTPPKPPYEHIPLGGSTFCIVDPEDYEQLSQYHWFAKKSSSRYYACRKVTKNGKTKFIRMHRQLAQTPAGSVCHHKNGDSLDNRKKNFENMRRGLHDMTHWKAGR